jgi:hypothetical protein
MWQYLITLFRELPDSLKLAIVLCLIVVLIAYTVWQINSWRKQRGLKYTDEGRRWFGAVADELERRMRQ